MTRLACLVVVAALATGAGNGHTKNPSLRVEKALRIASATWRVPYQELRSVAWCESRYNPKARNSSSGAAGLLQIMPRSTWLTTPYRDFSPYDPEANALAAAWIVRQDGSWRQWSCRP